MRIKYKKVLRTVLIVLPILIIIVAVYFFQFTRSYMKTVPYRPSFEKLADNIYVNKGNSLSQNEILSLYEQAKERDSAFYGELQSLDDIIIILCDDPKISSKIGEKDTITTYGRKTKSYICISNEYFNIDILSHELTHAELHTRLTKDALEKLPVWFNEGLATQNDYREKYSEEEWVKQTNNGEKALPLEDMDTSSEFYAGTYEEKQFRYMNAKHEVAEWMAAHGQEGLIDLIERLNTGEEFDSIYNAT